MKREEWLVNAARMFADHFADHSFRSCDSILITLQRPPITYPSLWLPDPFAQSCSRELNDDAVEIFISPYVDNSFDALSLLVHELTHAYVGLVSRHAVVGYLSKDHGSTFRFVANVIGLWGSHYLYRTHKLGNYLDYIIGVHGLYPRELV